MLPARDYVPWALLLLDRDLNRGHHTSPGYPPQGLLDPRLPEAGWLPAYRWRSAATMAHRLTGGSAPSTHGND